MNPNTKSAHSKLALNNAAMKFLNRRRDFPVLAVQDKNNPGNTEYFCSFYEVGNVPSSSLSKLVTILGGKNVQKLSEH